MGLKRTMLFIFLIVLNKLTYAGEYQMTQEYWHKKWKTKDIGWDQPQPNPLLITYFKKLNLKSGARIFVPLSGKSIDMFWLAEQGYRIIGVELNLEACKLFFTEHHIPYTHSKKGKFDILESNNITLMVGDFFDLDKKSLGNIDAIYDRAALIALPNDMQRLYAKKFNTLIEPRTQILLITFNYNQNEMQGPPFSVNENEVQRLFGEKFNIKMICKQPVLSIPEHLRAKGLTQVDELVFHLYST